MWIIKAICLFLSFLFFNPPGDVRTDARAIWMENAWRAKRGRMSRHTVVYLCQGFELSTVYTAGFSGWLGLKAHIEPANNKQLLEGRL